MQEINHLDPNKAIQANVIVTSIIKANKDLVDLYIYHYFNKVLSSFVSSTSVKYAYFKRTLTDNGKTEKNSDQSTLSHT